MNATMPIPSTRFALYFGLISFLWVAAAFTREFVVVALLCNLLLIFVAFLDWLLSPKPRQFEITRHLSDKMNLGVANTVVLEAYNRAGVPIELTVRDEPPPHWPVGKGAIATNSSFTNGVPPVARLVLASKPNLAVRGEYSITPTRRGEWQFGALSFRYRTRLGLWFRQARLAPAKGESQRVRVFPDMSEVRRFELRLREGRLRDIGLHLQRLRGRGSEYESLREYSSGDDYKDINWKASARRGALVATNYEIERDQTILIAIRLRTHDDCDGRQPRFENSAARRRGSFFASQTPLSKLDCAINASVLLAHVSASMGDAVGVLLFADTVLGFVPPRKGRAQTGTSSKRFMPCSRAWSNPTTAALTTTS
jgi:uncharacterized protein (DUF58 family)